MTVDGQPSTMAHEVRFALDRSGVLRVGNADRPITRLQTDLLATEDSVKRPCSKRSWLRLRSPWFLLRLDYGVKFDRRPGESSGRLFFSIGQAF